MKFYMRSIVSKDKIAWTPKHKGIWRFYLACGHQEERKFWGIPRALNLHCHTCATNDKYGQESYFFTDLDKAITWLKGWEDC